MVDQTPNHNLDYNYAKYDPWDYNDEMLRIEDYLPVRDVEANLGNYTPHDGATFVATDTNAVYDGDGNNWNPAFREFAGLSIDNRNVIDASEQGYPGDKSGGDIMSLITANPNSVFVLPEGDYSLQSALTALDDPAWDELTVIGKPHARLVVDDPAVEEFAALGNSTGGTFSKLSLQNLTLVVDGAAGLDAGWGRWYIDDRVENKNLSISGQRDRWQGGDGSGNAAGGDKFSYYCSMMTESGVGIHQNINLPDGEVAYTTTDRLNHTIGFGSEPEHVGTNYWIGCSVNEFWDNGFYVKDGDGPNILLGCRASNCGGSNIRLGVSDQAIACVSTWDYDLSTLDGFEGTLLDSDDGLATTVTGFRGRNDTSTTDCVRSRAVSQVVTYSDMHIENNTSQHAIRFSSSAGTHEDATTKLENCRIDDTGDTSIRASSVKVERANVRFEDVTINTANAGANRTCLHVEEGSARFDGMTNLLSGGTNYTVLFGGNGGGTTVDRAIFDGTYMDGGLYVYSGNTLNAAELINCDLRDQSTLFNNGSESSFGSFILENNLGLVSQNSGESVQSGDGSTATFTIAHGCYDVPNINLTPMTQDAQAAHDISVDATNISITFPSPPPTGTDNLIWNWFAEVNNE